jgi:poly-gamma-glutamate capsule biosynthesis protein CapA/YwtB (metallophosphatase superfamily)
MIRRDLLRWAVHGSLAALGLAGARVERAFAATRAKVPRQPTARGGSAALRLFLGGDVMTGRGIDQALPNPGEPQVAGLAERSALDYVQLAEEANGPIPQPLDFAYLWGDALEEMQRLAPAARLVNLETSITTSTDAWPDKAIHYRMQPANTPCLLAARIDGCCIANNHVLDFGYAGLQETLAALQQANIPCAGAGSNLHDAAAPAVIAAGQNRVLMFAAATRTSGVPKEWAAQPGLAGVNRIELYHWFVRQLAERVQAAKQPGDVAVLSIHWGSNWGYEIDEEQRRFAHRVIDEAGIDLLHGHSSHHPRGIEIYRNKAILYGCGDLINDYEGIRASYPEFRSALKLLYFPLLDPATGEIVRFEIVPMRMRRFRLQRATADEAAWLAATLDRNSRRMGARARLRDDGRIEVTVG